MVPILADSLDVVAEEESVLLIVAVTHLCQVSVDDAVMLAQIDNLHSCSIFISRYILKLACLLLNFCKDTI